VTVNPAFAEIDRENVTMRDTVTVKVAEAARVIYLVFCDRIETVLSRVADIVRYIVNAFPIVVVNVALAASVR
jgi:hypothetical protein